MGKIKVALKDGVEKEYPGGITPQEILEDIGGRLKKEALAARINGKVIDLKAPLNEDVQLSFVDFKDPEGEKIYRHSTSHILAQAVQRLDQEAKLGIGPAINDGFYYDFDLRESFSPEELEKIEEEMKRIIKEDLPVQRKELSREKALDLFKERGEDYKVELIKELPPGETISCYEQGEFIDLCAGPHVPSTGKIKSVKLLNLAGAYWRGDERNPMLQRIYGTSFPKKSHLEEYLQRLEEAKKRDHRKLGRELDLFSLHEEAPGFPFFHPAGMTIIEELLGFWREQHRKAGYQEIQTPIILNRKLWEQSGHWDHYQENMYFTKIDESDYAVKPMNCPGAMLVYNTKMHSYRDLPLRIAELGLVHRHELSGTLHGLMRVRCFTQDDAHIFMLPSQVKGEIKNILDLVDYFYKIFGFQYHVELSTRPEKAMGSREMWDMATRALREVLEENSIDYKVNEGEGAFYGPKIDFILRDCLNREWQCGTIQLDFQMPEKFDLFYIGEDGQKHRPVMIHRVVYGAIERFFALLIEQYAGAFPLWLSPVQVIFLPIADRHLAYAREKAELLKEVGLRVEIDDRNEKVGYKIREAQVKKIPYMLVVGDKEMESGQVAVRKRGEGDLGPQDLEEFLEQVKEEQKPDLSIS
ncbi:MAG: threonine--tRNA ligase [Candidatus Syntrophonatronum acetioxidans]|uniref:Threonine--tRNA ligase n=1 Tax=Candidatus Syntrophonatronum acetioxidans TaxID=1795816 RepID=A0A424YGW9_9FIRM|nr:MAG: threonine--tRNA ligase [Candidatus Syntrophonatronum acetioxidans]